MIFLTFLILAGPKVYYEKKEPKSPNEIVTIILDISKSMLADDISPNRLEKSKELISNILKQAPGTRFSLIVFAGKPFVLSPPSQDISAIWSIVQNMTTDTIRQNLPGLSGTNIGDALLLSHSIYEGKQTIILITDGRANIGIDPRIAVTDVVQGGSRVFTIGIGESSGSVLSYRDSQGVRQYFYDEKGEKIKADIDQEMLEYIADTTGGKFYQADESIAFDDIFESLQDTLFDNREYKNIKVTQDVTSLFLIILGIVAMIHAVILFYMRKM